MILLTIGAAERRITSRSDIDEQWINQQVNGRRADGQHVCVQVRVREDPIAVNLSTPGCVGGGGGRQPRPHERRIIDLWRSRGLANENFTGGNVVAFLHQLVKLVS